MRSPVNQATHGRLSHWPWSDVLISSVQCDIPSCHALADRKRRGRRATISAEMFSHHNNKKLQQGLSSPQPTYIYTHHSHHHGYGKDTINSHFELLFNTGFFPLLTLYKYFPFLVWLSNIPQEIEYNVYFRKRTWSTTRKTLLDNEGALHCHWVFIMSIYHESYFKESMKDILGAQLCHRATQKHLATIGTQCLSDGLHSSNK